jgi:hypothetical protein
LPPSFIRAVAFPGLVSSASTVPAESPNASIDKLSCAAEL